MGFLDIFKRKNGKQNKSDNTDLTPQLCCSSEWFCIGEYYYRIQISQKHINIKLRWEDYGTGGRLGWCDKQDNKEHTRYILVIKELFCNYIIDSVVALQPYKTITADQIEAHKVKLGNFFDENIRSSLKHLINDEERLIISEIYEAISDFNNSFSKNSIDINNIFIGEYINKPNSSGCFKKNDGWYLYYVDDRFNLLQQGPFTLSGIIAALCKTLHIPSEFCSRKFTDEEYNLYLSGYKYLKEQL
ncbi:MAG: hypothetical protein IKT46_04580 [Clostridia bacterium]|nr:hypothetical protein [Clostridia bacterium]